MPDIEQGLSSAYPNTTRLIATRKYYVRVLFGNCRSSQRELHFDLLSILILLASSEYSHSLYTCIQDVWWATNFKRCTKMSTLFLSLLLDVDRDQYIRHGKWSAMSFLLRSLKENNLKKKYCLYWWNQVWNITNNSRMISTFIWRVKTLDS